MERASPVQQRKALELANMFVRMGIGFVPIPVASEAEFYQGVNTAMNLLGEIHKAAEEAEASRA